MVRVALGTALRRGELLALRWSDVEAEQFKASRYRHDDDLVFGIPISARRSTHPN